MRQKTKDEVSRYEQDRLKNYDIDSHTANQQLLHNQKNKPLHYYDIKPRTKLQIRVFEHLQNLLALTQYQKE